MKYLTKVEKLDKQIAMLKQTRNNLLSSLQNECEHPIDFTREIEYQKTNYGTAIRPFRLCLRCGYAEEGWYCGYYKLHRNITDGHDCPIKGMDRKKALQLIKTFKTQRQLSEER